MKQGRKLTRFEKSCVQKQGKNPKDYVYAYKVSDSYFKIRHKQTGIEAIVNVFEEALYSQQQQDRELTMAQIMNSLLPNSDLN